MDITNDLNSQPNSTCAMGVRQFGVKLQTADDPVDTVDSSGRADIDRFTDFMRSLQPPPPAAQSASAQTGQQLFDEIGCAGCHTSSITTASNPASFLPPTISGTALSSNVNQVLANLTYHSYGDFLLQTWVPWAMVSMTTRASHMTRGSYARCHFGVSGRARYFLHDGQGKAAAAAFKTLRP